MERSDQRGVWGRVAPRCTPAHACAATSTSVRLLSPATRSVCDRGPPAPMPAWHLRDAPGGCHPAAAVLLVNAARPGLDPGTLRHYIAKPFKEGGQTAEGQWQAAQPRSRWQSDFLVRTPRMALRRRHTEPAEVAKPSYRL